MGFLRFSLRLLLLLLLLGSAASAFMAREVVTVILWLLLCAALVAAIYAVGFWRAKFYEEVVAHAREDEKHVRLWSDETPFLPTGIRDPLVLKYPVLAPFYPQLMPGAHVLAVRIVPFLAGLLAAGATWLLKGPSWQIVAWGAFFIVNFLAYTVYVRLVPARCVVGSCGGHAYLHNEIIDDAGNQGDEPLRRYVYICREHGHRQSTGINCFGWCPDAGVQQKNRL
jgi:hypothetical protein